MPHPGRTSRRRLALYAMELLICAVISLPLGSCSILLPVGAAQSNRRYPRGDLEVARTKGLPGNVRIMIATHDGDSLRGVFRGLHPMPAKDYAVRFAKWREAHPKFPALGDEIVLVMPNGRRPGRFEGFGLASVWLTIGRHDLREYPMEDWRALRLANGTELHPDSLRAVATGLPMRLELAMYFAGGVPDFAREYARNRWTARIPLSEIGLVEIRGNVASVGGALVKGVLIDGVMGLAMVGAALAGAGGGCAYSVPIASLEADSSRTPEAGGGTGGAGRPALAAPAR